MQKVFQNEVSYKQESETNKLFNKIIFEQNNQAESTCS